MYDSIHVRLRPYDRILGRRYLFCLTTLLTSSHKTLGLLDTSPHLVMGLLEMSLDIRGGLQRKIRMAQNFPQLRKGEDQPRIGQLLPNMKATTELARVDGDHGTGS